MAADLLIEAAISLRAKPSERLLCRYLGLTGNRISKVRVVLAPNLRFGPSIERFKLIRGDLCRRAQLGAAKRSAISVLAFRVAKAVAVPLTQ